MSDDAPAPTVQYRLDDGVAVVTLDDGKANAMGPTVLAALTEALDRAEAEATALLLVGGAKAFSAGYDLSVMTESDEAMRGLVKAGATFLMRLYGSPLPTVGACTGHALAGGALTLLALDERVGPSDTPSKLGLNEVAIGMPLPQFAVEMARDRIATAHLTDAVLGRVYDPATAVEAGFLDRVVPRAEVVDVATDAARAKAGLRRGAVDRTKQALRGEMVAGILAGLDADLAELTGPRPG